MELLIGYTEVISNVYYIYIYMLRVYMLHSEKERQRNMMHMIKYYLSIKMKTKKSMYLKYFFNLLFGMPKAFYESKG